MEASLMLMLMLGVGQIDEPGPPQPPVVAPPPLPPVPPVQPPPVPPRPTLPPSECPSFCEGLNDSVPAICDMCKGETLTDACALVRCQAGYVCVARSTKGVCEPVRHLQCGAESCQSGFKCEMDGQTPSPIKYSCAAEAHGCFAKDGTLFTDEYLDKSTAVGHLAGTLWKCQRFPAANGTFYYITISHGCTMRNSLDQLVVVGSAAVEVDGSYFLCRTRHSSGETTSYIAPTSKPRPVDYTSTTETCTDASGTEHNLHTSWAEKGVLYHCGKEGPTHLVCPLSIAIGCAVNATSYNGQTYNRRLLPNRCHEQQSGTNGSTEYSCCEELSEGNGYRLHSATEPSCVVDGKVIALKSNYTKPHKAGMKLFHPLDRGVWYSCEKRGHQEYSMRQQGNCDCKGATQNRHSGCAVITDDNRVSANDFVTIKDKQFICNYNYHELNYQLLPILENDCVTGSGAYFRNSATVDNVSVVCRLKSVYVNRTVVGMQFKMLARGCVYMTADGWQRTVPVYVHSRPRLYDGRLLSCVGDENNVSSVQLIEHEATTTREMDSSTQTSAASANRNGCVDSAGVRRANYEEWQDRVLPHGAIQYRCYHGSIRSRGCLLFPDGADSNKSYSLGSYYSLTSLIYAYISADRGFLVCQSDRRRHNISYTHEPACYFNGQRYFVGEHRLTREADDGLPESVELIECTVSQWRLQAADVQAYNMRIKQIGCLGPDGQVWPNRRSAEVNGKAYKCLKMGYPATYRIFPYEGSYGCEDSQGNIYPTSTYYHDGDFSYWCREINPRGSTTPYVTTMAEMQGCVIGPDKVEIVVTSSRSASNRRQRSKQVCVGGDTFLCYRDDDNKLHLEKLQ